MPKSPKTSRSLTMLALAMVLALTATTGAIATQRSDYPWRDMQQETFEVADGGTLRVRVDDADVTILAGDAGRAAVTIRLRSNDMDWAVDRFERTNYRARLEGGTVVVDSDDEPRGSWVSGTWMSVIVEVTVPARFDLDIRTQDGDISAAAFEGDAALQTQDGDVTVESLTGGDVRLDTQDGDVRAASLSGDTVRVLTQDGDIEVDAARGALTMATQDGDIRIGAADAPDLDLSTSDGDIRVAIGGDGRLELETHDGDIDIEAPSSLRADIDLEGEDVSVRGGFSLQGNVTHHRARGTINGGGGRIRARTGDGTVRLTVRQAP